jgi:hypothetical protein
VGLGTIQRRANLADGENQEARSFLEVPDYLLIPIRRWELLSPTRLAVFTRNPQKPKQLLAAGGVGTGPNEAADVLVPDWSFKEGTAQPGEELEVRSSPSGEAPALGTSVGAGQPG